MNVGNYSRYKIFSGSKSCKLDAFYALSTVFFSAIQAFYAKSIISIFI